MAYNDQIGMQVPMKTEFRGAVPGKFLELLKVRSEERLKIELVGSNNELVVKQGKRTNFRLVMLEPNFIFAMPKAVRTDKLAPKSMERLIDAIAHSLISVGRDTSTIEQLGITLEPKDGGEVTLYATDGATISRSKLKSGMIELAARAIIPTKFCEQMIALYRALPDSKDKDADFEIGTMGTTRYALFRAGKTSLYGRLLESRNPLNFEGTVAYHLPRDHSSKLVEVPSALHAALERACIVCDAQRRLTHIILDQGKMVLKSKSDTEEVTDELPYPHNGTGRLEVKVEPKLLKKAEDYNKMMIHGPCVIMAKGLSVYLVSCSSA
jgi:DNA polymerase III sliding clamp (beta) subunit (PCNA family)